MPELIIEAGQGKQAIKPIKITNACFKMDRIVVDDLEIEYDDLSFSPFDIDQNKWKILIEQETGITDQIRTFVFKFSTLGSMDTFVERLEQILKLAKNTKQETNSLAQLLLSLYLTSLNLDEEAGDTLSFHEEIKSKKIVKHEVKEKHPKAIKTSEITKKTSGELRKKSQQRSQQFADLKLKRPSFSDVGNYYDKK